jgi:hypothetical protein
MLHALHSLLASLVRSCSTATGTSSCDCMQVSVDHRPGARVNVWGLDARTPAQFKFKLKGSGQETTVADYFRRTYPHMQFSHLHDWPCVMVSQSGAAVPLEFCR